MKYLSTLAITALTGIGLLMPELAFAASSPFSTGSGALSNDILTILTPVAGIAVMAAGVLAGFGRISWPLAISIVVGIVLIFGAQQLVDWVRGLFGV
jgi:type IV secretion system protein VirB2